MNNVRFYLSHWQIKIRRMKISKLFSLAFILTLSLGCSESNQNTVKDPDSAEVVAVDRFSDDFGTLMRRSDNSRLPGPNDPIDFDNGFITQSFGPDGQIVKYYNFDVQSLYPAPIYVLFKEGSKIPVENQLNIINVIPGDYGYNDFWQVFKVTVSDSYMANTYTSLEDIMANNLDVEPTIDIVNCPVVPKGSKAEQRYNNSDDNYLHQGWYKGKLVFYFNFDEKVLTLSNQAQVPTSPIYVTFNINPDENNAASGPVSGFVMETGSVQTHNITATVPEDFDYSAFWAVTIYDNADFSMVNNLESVLKASWLVQNATQVNCPIIYSSSN